MLKKSIELSLRNIKTMNYDKKYVNDLFVNFSGKELENKLLEYENNLLFEPCGIPAEVIEKGYKSDCVYNINNKCQLNIKKCKCNEYWNGEMEVI